MASTFVPCRECGGAVRFNSGDPDPTKRSYDIEARGGLPTCEPCGARLEAEAKPGFFSHDPEIQAAKEAEAKADEPKAKAKK